MREYSSAVTKPRRKPTTREGGQPGLRTGGQSGACVYRRAETWPPRGEVPAQGKEASGNIYPGYCRINAIILLLWETAF